MFGSVGTLCSMQVDDDSRNSSGNEGRPALKVDGNSRSSAEATRHHASSISVAEANRSLGNRDNVFATKPSSDGPGFDGNTLERSGAFVSSFSRWITSNDVPGNGNRPTKHR